MDAPAKLGVRSVGDICEQQCRQSKQPEQSEMYRYQEFFIFLVVSKQIVTGKKCRNRYGKNLVP